MATNDWVDVAKIIVSAILAVLFTVQVVSWMKKQ